MAAALAFQDLGFACDGRWLLRDVTQVLPASGLLHLRGPAAGLHLVGQALARQVLPPVQMWGCITLGNIDLRVSVPAIVISEETVPAPDRDVTSLILSRVAAGTMLRLMNGDPATTTQRLAAYAAQVLRNFQLEEISVAAELRSLSPAQRLSIALAAAATTGTKVVWITHRLSAFSAADQALLAALLQRLSRYALIILSAAAGESAAALGAAVATLPAVPSERVAIAPGHDPLDHHRLPGFHWIIAGQLAGMARPGSGLQEVREDLAALVALGVDTVVTLEEQAVQRPQFDEHGLHLVHLPIADMSAPSRQGARDVAQAASALMDQRRAVVFHCRGGVGRTGTLLACTMIVRGHTAAQAIELLRQISPYYIQSPEQFAFLEAFEQEAA